MDLDMEDGAPNAALSDPFERMRLQSQSQSQAPLKRPVPLFSQTANDQNLPPREAPDVPCSQLEYMASADYDVTPADQFQLEYDPCTTNAKNLRSPAQISPSRAKRPRGAGTEPDFDGSQGAGQDSSQDGAAPGRPHVAVGNPYARAGRQLIPRCRSPLTYRSIFRDTDGEREQFADWRAARPANQGLPRFKAEFKELGLLGHGCFSKVYHTRHRLDGREYAVKRSHNSVDTHDPQFVQFLQEVQLMANVPPHPNIVRYFGSWLEADPPPSVKNKLYTQLEKCDVSLQTHSSLSGGITEAHILVVLRQMCAALAHLHAHGIAHMDVKPDNIYLLSSHCDGDEEGAGTVYKLGDFGQAVRLAALSNMVVDEGDARFLPHEVMNGDYSALDKADMFSLGASLYDLVTKGSLPAEGQQYQDLRQGKLPLLPTVTRPLYNLIRSLLSPKPEDRPSADKVLRSALCNKVTQAGPVGVGGQQPSSGSSVPPVAGSIGGGGKVFGGLVLQRTHLS